MIVNNQARKLRKLASQYRDLSLAEVRASLRSHLHEERVLALLILVQRYGRGDETQQQRICDLYLENSRYINNWDLVDCSAEHIVGAHLYRRDRAVLATLAASASLREWRIAVMATFHFIRRGEFAATLHLAEMLLEDEHDLIHKAVGWMLREVGKRDLHAAETFLRSHGRLMPRTILRYAIERFPEAKRLRYLRSA